MKKWLKMVVVRVAKTMAETAIAVKLEESPKITI